MPKIKFSLRILAAVFAAYVISNSAIASEKSDIFLQMGRSGGVMEDMLYQEVGTELSGSGRHPLVNKEVNDRHLLSL